VERRGSAIRLQHTTPPFRTHCGPDALAALPRELDRLGGRRVVVVCGASIRRHASALERVEAAVGDRLAGRFEGVQQHSPLPAVEAARRMLADAEADSVIAVGGGSAIVTARAAVILLAEGKDVRQLCTRRADDGRLVSPRLSAPKLPMWVVPSTPTTAYAKAGSAVRDPDTGERLALFDPKTRAQGVILDPEVALTAPPALAQAAALNALTMAVDGLQSTTDDPLADALLLHALRMLGEWLPLLESTPDDAEPRLRLMLAALLAGQGSDHVGGGLTQALAHAAGPLSSTSNGVVEALLLPHTMRYNAPVTGPRLVRIAEALDGASGDGGPAHERAVAAVERLMALVRVPARLRDVGVERTLLGQIADHARDDWTSTRVPRPADRADLTALLQRAW
jgi:alcohol dehydrogenase class IV